MESLPKFWNYGKYSSSNYGAHSLAVTVGSLTIYFSYKTPIAFCTGGRRYVRENEWGPTTGKHLNWIDDGEKKNRIPGEQFEEMLSQEIRDREGKAVASVLADVV